MKTIFNENELITKIDNYGELNTSQTKCLKKVFKNSLNMIQGPPETGKTFLASFIIYNIFQKRIDDKDKILVCAPSNSAADNLALCLMNLNKSFDAIIFENDHNNKIYNKNEIENIKKLKEKDLNLSVNDKKKNETIKSLS